MTSILLARAVRFALTGFVVTGLHFFVAVVLIEYLLFIPPLANGVAFMVATIASYLINTIWSFSGQLHGKTIFRFAVVSIGGFSMAMLISWGADKLGFDYLLGICAVAIIMPPTTFMLHNFWTYSVDPTE